MDQPITAIVSVLTTLPTSWAMLTLAVAAIAMVGLGYGLGRWWGPGRLPIWTTGRGNPHLNTSALYALDPDGIIHSWNAAAEQTFSHLAKDLYHRSFTVLFPAQSRREGVPQTMLTHATTLGLCERIDWLERKDGSRFWAHMMITAAYDHQRRLIGFNLIICDNTRRHFQDERIHFQAALLNRVRSAILATDSHGGLVYMNAYAESLFLLPWSQAKGCRLADLGLFPDDLADPIASPLSQPHAGWHRMERDVVATRRDGSSFPALCITTISPDPNGEGYAEVHLVHDISELKRMQEALHHAANLAMLGRMSASLVHEISQPMNVIRLTAEGGLLKMDRQQASDDDLRQRLQTISQQAARLFETIDFMQIFGRSDSAAGHPLQTSPLRTPAPFDIKHSIREAVSVLRLPYQNAAVDLVIDLPPEPCWAIGQARQVEQVLINLLSNALHAVLSQTTGLKRVQVTLADQPSRQSIVQKTMWQICIEDSGPGIAPSLREKIFQPFFTTKPIGQGSGLGLAISLGIARAMGGDLAIDTAALGGARLVFRLQATPPHQQIVTPLAPPQIVPSAEIKRGAILIIDDEDLARQEMADYLRSCDYQVTTAHGGHAAQQMISDPHAPLVIDAVITDLRMADGDGYQLLAFLAADYPQVFTIVVTGQPLHDRQSIAENDINADAVFRKPLSLPQLAETLADLLGQSVKSGSDDGDLLNKTSG